MRRICSIYRSAKRDGMYLYVDKAEGLTRVPEALMNRFGQAEHAMTLLIAEDRKLARADAKKVLQDIEDNGFYLQLPPADAELPLNPREDR